MLTRAQNNRHAASGIGTAVIMAAGMGVRLRRMGELLPKGFARVGDLPLVENSVQQLLKAGIGRIVIVTGHLANYYEDLRQRYPDTIELVHNEAYAASGSMYSLYCAKEHVEGDFLLLESDIIYEQRALTVLLTSAAPDVVLCSGETGSDDAVFVAAENGELRAMSKDRGALHDPVFGELVGICKVSGVLFEHMLDTAQQTFEKTRQVAYETDCLVAVAQNYSIHCHRVADLVWSEIDNDEHLQHARDVVYPKLQRIDSTPGQAVVQRVRTVRKNLRTLRKAYRRPVSLSGANYTLVKRMFLDVTGVLNEAGVRYMIDRGTLIGIARDGDLLPWEDDVELALPRDQLERVLQLLPTLRARGYRIGKRYMHYDFFCWSKGDLQAIKIRKVRWGVVRSRVRLDINVKYRHEDKYYWHSMGEACEVNADYFDDAEEIMYAAHSIKVPARFEAYLEEKYGDWRTPDRELAVHKHDSTTIGRIAPGNPIKR